MSAVPVKLLISHATEDQRAAAVLKELIERCSLRRIEVWFSSDQSAFGGIAIGTSWFANLMQRLSNTNLIVALVTPNSIGSPWLYFECGHLSSRAGGTSIVPLTLGVSVSDLPMPLSAFQGHDLSESTSVSVFLEKLFAFAGVPYDEEMTRGIRESTSRRLLELGEESRPKAQATLSERRTEIDDLRSYLDKRFLELHTAFSVKIKAPANQTVIRNASAELRVEVVDKNGLRKNFVINMHPGSSLQKILDECYFRMNGMVNSYQYLNQWVVRDLNTGEVLLSKGEGDTSPAIAFFDPTHVYRIYLLDKPYVSDMNLD